MGTRSIKVECVLWTYELFAMYHAFGYPGYLSDYVYFQYNTIFMTCKYEYGVLVAMHVLG